jgi:hypothetical protein
MSRTVLLLFFAKKMYRHGVGQLWAESFLRRMNLVLLPSLLLGLWAWGLGWSGSSLFSLRLLQFLKSVYEQLFHGRL